MAPRLLSLLLICLVSGATFAVAQETPRLEPLPASLPAELPDWLAPLLDENGVRTLSGDTVLADFWFRQELPERQPTGEMGVEFGTLPEGGLVGLVRLGSTWHDYKNKPVPAGLYTLRYGVQPADGDHTGQTWFRDFLMLLPIDQDIFQPDGAAQEPVVEASKKATSTTHPAVMAIFGVYDEISEPTIVLNDLDQPMLAVERGDLLFGLVLEGHGEEVTM